MYFTEIFEFSLIDKTFRLNWENFDPINRKLTQLTENILY